MLASISALPALLVGGEWAGWCCSYSTTGLLRPVPATYLSDTAIEWGQIPAGFEELITETVGDAGRLERRTTRILPEDGCNIEDLPATFSRAAVGFSSVEDAPLAPLVLDSALGENVWHLETLLPGLGVAPCAKPKALPCSASRTRLTLTFDAAAGEIRGGSVSAWQVKLLFQSHYLDALQSGGRVVAEAGQVVATVPCQVRNAVLRWVVVRIRRALVWVCNPFQSFVTTSVCI